MNKETISVIIPIYNIEKYIGKCTESVLGQSYSNLEIILVDDGSTDNSPLICDNYKRKDKRIKVIHKRNGGLSDARNAGIEKSTGNYLFFLDGDDYISKDCINELYETLISNNSDISTTQYICFYDGDTPKGKTGSSITLSTEDALQDLMYQKHCTNSAWGKLYKKELFNGIRYPKGKICEDLATTYLLFDKANMITINTSKNYFYLQRANSIIKTKFKLERAEALTFAREETNYIKKHHPKIVNSAINREFMEAVYIIIAINNNANFNTITEKAYSIIKKYRKIILRDPLSEKRSKKFAVLSYFGKHALTATNIAIRWKNRNKSKTSSCY